MNSKEKLDSWRDSTLPVPASPTTRPTQNHSPTHRPRPEELWASPQRLRYLRSLAPENHPSPQ